MSSQFIAKPPQAVDSRSLLKLIGKAFIRFVVIVWQIVVPFKSRPEEIDPFLESADDIDDAQVEQSQWIFDQAEERRAHLEQKAQSTFALMLFLVPLLASLFVFISSKVPPPGGASRTIAGGLLLTSAACLFLGFVSAVRAVSVRGSEGLFLHSVLDETGQFRKYNKAFHAHGLLYCAAMNQAMNDHRAQFVKGAQLFTAAAVIGLVITAIPASSILSKATSSPTETKVVGPVDISSKELRELRDELKSLKADLQTLVSNRQASTDRVKKPEEKVGPVDENSSPKHHVRRVLESKTQHPTRRAHKSLKRSS